MPFLTSPVLISGHSCPKYIPDFSNNPLRTDGEIQAVSALNHPNIVILYDIGSDRGIDFLVLEYLPGKTLKQLIPPEGLPLLDVARYGAQMILTTTHISNMLHEPPGGRLRSPVNRRERFIRAHGRFLWKGDFEKNGMMMPALGGRGIVAGAQLRRFYPRDFTLWDKAHWPNWAHDLSAYYTLAEVRRHVHAGDCDGGAQNWVLGQLNPLNAAAPPWGVDSPTVRNLEAGEGYDSSVSRLWRMVIDDHQTSIIQRQKRRLLVATHAYATRIGAVHGRANEVICTPLRDDWGVPMAHVTVQPLSERPEDENRFHNVAETMRKLAERLGVTEKEFMMEKVELFLPGRSHHEAGTLRMGHPDDRSQPSVTDTNGKVHSLDNLYVADASLFPCVGVANPMLTVTVLGYRLADHLANQMKNTRGQRRAQRS